MTRLIKKEEQRPFEIPPSDKSKWICMCGLSKNQPFCDSSHHKTKDELEGKLYKYNEDGTREGLNE